MCPTVKKTIPDSRINTQDGGIQCINILYLTNTIHQSSAGLTSDQNRNNALTQGCHGRMTSPMGNCPAEKVCPWEIIPFFLIRISQGVHFNISQYLVNNPTLWHKIFK